MNRQDPNIPKCPLLDLPPEVRLHVYSYFLNSSPFYTCLPLWIFPDLGIRDTRYSHDRVRYASVRQTAAVSTQTCRFINAEISPLLYNCLLFRIHASYANHNQGPEADITSFFPKMQHLELVIPIYQRSDIKDALLRLQTVADWVEGAKLKTLWIRVRVFGLHYGGRDGEQHFDVRDVEKVKDELCSMRAEDKASPSRLQQLLELAKLRLTE